MEKYIPESEIAEFSSPFIEERLYFVAVRDTHIVLLVRSRPLLSRSGCILNKALL